MIYKGIELELPKGKPHLTTSRAFDLIRKETSTRNMDWNDVLCEIPWGRLKDICPDLYKEACCLFSLLKMDYQVCNGGIGQYFYNKYHEAWEPRNENDGELFDFEQQKVTFSDYVELALTIFPNRSAENLALEKACKAFALVEFEENAEFSETIECEEDEYIMDEETGEEIENPDYFEPYEESYYEDTIHNGDSFEAVFFDANDYLEEIFEIQSQVLCKQLARELGQHFSSNPKLVGKITEILPESAFRKPSLSSQIQNADGKAAAAAGVKSPEKEAFHNFIDTL